MPLVHTDEVHFDSAEQAEILIPYANPNTYGFTQSFLDSHTESFSHSRNRSGVYCPWTVNLPYLDFLDDNWGSEYIPGYFGPCYRITELTASIDGVDPWEFESIDNGWHGAWSSNAAVYAPDFGWTGGPLVFFEPYYKNYASLYPEAATEIQTRAVYNDSTVFPNVRTYRQFPHCNNPWTLAGSTHIGISVSRLIGVGNRPGYNPWAMQRGIWDIQARCTISGSIADLWQGASTLRLWIHNVGKWWNTSEFPYALGVPAPSDINRGWVDGGFGVTATPATTGSVSTNLKLDIPVNGDWVTAEFHQGWCYGGMGIEYPEQHFVPIAIEPIPTYPYWYSSDGECHVEIRAKLRGT